MLKHQVRLTVSKSSVGDEGRYLNKIALVNVGGRLHFDVRDAVNGDALLKVPHTQRSVNVVEDGVDGQPSFVVARHPNSQLHGFGTEGRNHEGIHIERAAYRNGVAVSSFAKNFERNASVVKHIGIQTQSRLVQRPVEAQAAFIQLRIFVQLSSNWRSFQSSSDSIVLKPGRSTAATRGA